MSKSLRFAAAFGAVFAVLYVAAMEANWAAFTYHPRLMEFGLGVEPSRSGPAMYWYGWMATAAAGGLLAGLAAAVPPQGAARPWYLVGWIAPAAALLASAYFMIPFFTR